MTIIFFLLMLGVLIAIHEAGHMLVAKACGMYVREYAIGFGPKIFSRKGKETTYTLRCIPLGGYTALIESEGDNLDHDYVVEQFVEKTGYSEDEIVKLLNNLGFNIKEAVNTLQQQEQPISDETAQELLQLAEFDSEHPFIEEKRTFYGAHPLKRLAVLFAGPVSNLILAFLIFIGIYVGIGQTAVYPDAIIGEVNANSPAQQAGIQVGDEIISITFEDGDVVEVTDTYDVSYAIQLHEAQSMTLTINRDGEEITISVTPEYDDEEERYLIGIVFAGEITYESLSVGEAIVAGFEYTVEYIVLTVVSIFQLFTGQLGLENVSGTIGMYTYTEEALSYGFVTYLSLVGAISISLGLMNLVPIPVFDGGKILITIIEMIIGHRVSSKVETALNYFGLAVVLLLFVMVTISDISKLFG